MTDRRALDAALAKRRPTLLCNYCDPNAPGVINLFDVLEEQLAYWRGQLGGMASTLSLPTDRPRPAVQSFQGARLSFAGVA